MYLFLESARLALTALWANKLRSFMTVLGNIVAVTSIVAVVSLIQGLNATVSDLIVSDIGADSFTIARRGIVRTEEDEERTRNNPLLTLEEADAIRRFSTRVVSVMAQASRNSTVSYGTAELENIQITGVTSEYANFSNFDAERGRMMSAIEVERSRPVAIVGWEVADRLFGDANPLDKEIRIAGVKFRVVGVSRRRGAVFGQPQDQFAIIPLGAYMRLFGARQSLTLLVKPASPDVLEAAMDEATVALRVARRLKPSQPNNFGMLTSETVIGLYQQATEGIFAVLVGIVALSLVVGGIVIMNIMLMVVSERTREIGLRKALGARRADIMAQVLTESITLSTFGGVVGIVLGFLFALGLAAATPLPATLEPWSIVLGVAITAAVGLFFGAYPASRAAALDPIEALRRE
ncbi:MAG TPA: ABC transporter permease [Vicinamibacterales bacterium]|nr:ABC transporter permease [Vicinamibacterales bacterium]